MIFHTRTVKPFEFRADESEMSYPMHRREMMIEFTYDKTASVIAAHTVQGLFASDWRVANLSQKQVAALANLLESVAEYDGSATRCRVGLYVFVDDQYSGATEQRHAFTLTICAEEHAQRIDAANADKGYADDPWVYHLVTRRGSVLIGKRGGYSIYGDGGRRKPVKYAHQAWYAATR